MYNFNKPLKLTKYNNQSTINEIVVIQKGEANTNFGLENWQVEVVNKLSSLSTYIFNSEKSLKIIGVIDTKNIEEFKASELLRKLGNKLFQLMENSQISESKLKCTFGIKNEYFIGEGMALSSYNFDKYLSTKAKIIVKNIFIDNSNISDESLEELNLIVESNFIARDLVNEPLMFLDAPKLGDLAVEICNNKNIEVTVLGKDEIIKENLIGTLSVNYGSQTPPRFIKMIYNPSNSKNKEPFVLVGKGIVYDTGGLSLKPSSGMDSMKSDMAGAATVISTISLIAKNNLPVYVVALVPATDNRPGENAQTPGDIIQYKNGISCEVLNTDAEGRLVLADALIEAKTFNPKLCIDVATLTGAQVMALGHYGAAIMGNANEEFKNDLKKSSFDTFEKVAELPFWDEYGDLINSNIADIKNTSGKYGGCIAAGKFLERFVSYPWIHIDIAGPSFLDNGSHYMKKGATGYGVRLLYDFIKKQIEK